MRGRVLHTQVALAGLQPRGDAKPCALRTGDVRGRPGCAQSAALGRSGVRPRARSQGTVGRPRGSREEREGGRWPLAGGRVAFSRGVPRCGAPGSGPEGALWPVAHAALLFSLLRLESAGTAPLGHPSPGSPSGPLRPGDAPCPPAPAGQTPPSRTAGGGGGGAAGTASSPPLASPPRATEKDKGTRHRDPVQ